MSIYSHLDYRSLLSERISQAKSRTTSLTMSRLAERTGIQPSYLTHVLKGRADFSPDQLYAISEHLHFSREEREYVLLLLEYERSSHVARKAELKAQIDLTRERSLATEEHIKAKKVNELGPEEVEYYLDPLCQLVHVHLNFEEFAREPLRLAKRLAISESHLEEILGRLQSAGYIEPEGRGYRVVRRNRHLPKTSPLCQPHQVLMRYKSIDQIQRIPEKERVAFSVTFSSTQEDKQAIHHAFLEFVKKAESIVQSSRREHVYQINFDLFPWSLD